jgi:hypothetical protein
MIDFVERIFRTVEMIALLALSTKLLSERYPLETNALVYLLGWGTSFYVLSGIADPLHAHYQSRRNAYTHEQRILASAFISVAAFAAVIFVVHPLVIAIAAVPFVP